MTAPAEPISFEQFWFDHFAARHAAAIAAEEQWQDEAFAGQPHTVCGLTLRGLSGYDLLLLHGCGNPFIVGGVIHPESIAQFLSILVEPVPRGYFRRRRFFKHIRNLCFLKASEEIKAYVDRMFANSGLPRSAPASDESGEGSSPVATNMCFLAPLVIRIAGATGWAEEHILAMRLDKLFQYRRAITAEGTGKSGYPAADKLISQAMEAHGLYLATGELPLPESPAVHGAFRTNTGPSAAGNGVS